MDATSPELMQEHTSPPRRLLRSRTNRVFAGVCAGIADYFGGDPTMVRLGAAILGIVTGIVPMLVVYIVAAIVIPERGGAPAGEAVGPAIPATPGSGTLVLGVLLVGVGVMALANEVLRVDWDLLWPVGLVLLGGALLLTAMRRQT